MHVALKSPEKHVITFPSLDQIRDVYAARLQAMPIIELCTQHSVQASIYRQTEHECVCVSVFVCFPKQ